MRGPGPQRFGDIVAAVTSRRTEELAALDLAHVWHPFTQMQDYGATEPLIVQRAEGNWLIDTEGRRYLDGFSSLWCNVHGHRVDAIDQAIREQLAEVAHSTLLGSASVPSIELAARLAAVAPTGLTRVFYAENGASAVEIALKMAYQHWQQRGETSRRRFLAFDNAYHGDTLGAVAVGGIDLFHSTFQPLLFDVLRAPSPYLYRCPDGHQTHEQCGEHVLTEVERLLRRHRGEVCAVILEPLVQGAAGMITQPRGFVARLAEICRAEDTLLILDEVATGFGRTGSMFACEQEGVSPDLLVLGKGLTGGYLPLSAVLTSDSLYEGFLGDPTSGRTFFHGHTYTGNQLCCAAALANLDLFEQNAVVDLAAARAVELAGLLEETAELWPVGEVRQRGLMVGIELVRDRDSREPFPAEARAAWNLCQRLRRRGILIRPLGEVVVLMPPLSITSEELRLLAGAVGDELLAIPA
jgi:adenosylmethionine-8-amino-7-oxononanoate aminotransferase